MNASTTRAKQRHGYSTFSVMRHLAIAITLCACAITTIAATASSAKSYSEIFVGIDMIQVWVQVDADPTTLDLVNADRVRAELIEELRGALSEDRPNIRIDAGSGLGAPELREVDSGTLQIILSLTVRQINDGGEDLPCCFGAFAMRLDRDTFRRRQTSELIFSEDRFRLNWPPQALFLGEDPDEAVERVVGTSRPFLQEIVEVLKELPPK